MNPTQPTQFWTEADSSASCEVLVIGSGAGGAPTAALLAEAGFDVIVVEEGKWVEQGSVAPFSLEQMDQQYRSGGVTVALGLPSIAYTEGRCAGGGTEVNSGLYRRPPGEVVERWRDRWQINELDPDSLLSIASEVEQAIHVVPLPGPASKPSELLGRGAESLGWQFDESPRWMKYPNNDIRQGQRQSMTRTYLPRAAHNGARILTNCRVNKLHMKNTSATSAEVTLGTGKTARISFKYVFVCGGAIQTPAILQRSGLHKNIGNSLAVHPTVKLAARFSEAINIPDDVPVHQVKEFAPDLSFGGSASHAGLMALALLDQWSQFGSAIEQWRHMAIYYAAITSVGRGRVISVPGLKDPIVTYRLTRRDRELLRSGLSRLSLLMLEAGATEVFPSFRDAPIVRGRNDLTQLQNSFNAMKASVMSVHLCSTVAMGENRALCGADSFGKIHDTHNVYVNDASLLPDAPGVNPQASVMAIAIRNIRHFISREQRNV